MKHMWEQCLVLSSNMHIHACILSLLYKHTHTYTHAVVRCDLLVLIDRLQICMTVNVANLKLMVFEVCSA